MDRYRRGGLNYFDKKSKRFYVIDKKLGLEDDVVHSIVEDSKQNIWISTDVGMFKLSFKKFSLPFKKEDIEITNYSANDGLISNQFSTLAAVRLKTNELLFGGMNGLSIFYPEKIIKNKKAPKVVLTEILINNKAVKINGDDSPLSRSISELKEITVDYNQANISLKYAALNFINPENNQYAYKLEGFSVNEDWQLTGKQRVVNFANLAPGSHLFKVKASNNDGVWSNEVTNLKIIVLPPWWLTWWAYLLYAAIIVLVSSIIINFLRNRARLKRDLYLEHLQNERQQELYQMKLNFFTNISHEIRTPLTLILGPLERLISGDNHPKFIKQLELIKNNADRLMKLVTELLDFRKAEEGHMRIYCSYQDIIPFSKDIYESFRNLAIDRNIDYQFVAPKEPIFLYFDKNQLEKVIFNLLSNAFKFTPDNGCIKVEIAYQEGNKDWIEIKVTDTGKGIPEDFQNKLFDSFFQVDDRGHQNIGSGIGLALSKSIIELHRGKIRVSSKQAENKLTVFTIELRTGKNHLAESEVVSESAYIENYQKSFMPYHVPAYSHDEAEVSNQNKKYKLLIAEDNDEVRGLIADTLRDEYEIVEFTNGQLALDYMQEEIPDLIISDIMMPGLDGLQLCEKAKSSESTSHIPFILLTARASVAHQVDGLSIGADAYISKPFSLQILLLNIRNLLKAQEVMREKFSQQVILQPSNTAITSPEEKFIQKLIHIIEDKMGNPEFDVNELVNEIGMSRTVLYKKVQTLTSYSVAELIKQMRLKKAAELFKISTFSIAEVAYMVGFNDRKHFSKEFKKQYQLSPSEFLQSVKQTD
ncbi:response regulator [Pedobacter aquae]|uniref:histidine kinase n=1 Tax=Pedobacter aquae TaxID=2605747 RepID=A0A5C0VGD4_9SPHI|nr:hybrid sensor histidine kinase/response regulator transcription factor [Pedobacter aquae]QEK51725.1 response regulator [Pedobacter aquae]